MCELGSRGWGGTRWGWGDSGPSLPARPAPPPWRGGASWTLLTTFKEPGVQGVLVPAGNMGAARMCAEGSACGPGSSRQGSGSRSPACGHQDCPLFQPWPQRQLWPGLQEPESL